MLAKLRGGTAPFQIEMGKWQGREEYAKNARMMK